MTVSLDVDRIGSGAGCNWPANAPAERGNLLSADCASVDPRAEPDDSTQNFSYQTPSAVPRSSSSFRFRFPQLDSLIEA
jgi:hypothetical protein